MCRWRRNSNHSLPGLVSLLLAIASMAYVSGVAAAQEWTVELTATEGLAQTAVEFGIADGATDGIDAALFEVEWPPPGPFPSFDLRLTGPTYPSGMKLDLRSNAEDAHTYQLLIWEKDPAAPVILTWDPTSLPPGPHFELLDPFGGALVADMRDEGSVMLTPFSLASLVVSGIQQAPPDMTPPEIALETTESSLWPPNHKMQLVSTGISASDESDPNPALEVEVTSSEPDDGEPDWEVVPGDDGTYEVWVRAERDGSGSGRIYTILATATDASGNTTTASAEVTVAHDQGKRRRNGGKGGNGPAAKPVASLNAASWGAIKQSVR
jgi:hypothetical protein